jgi:hypothetical protein
MLPNLNVLNTEQTVHLFTTMGLKSPIVNIWLFLKKEAYLTCFLYRSLGN